LREAKVTGRYEPGQAIDSTSGSAALLAAVAKGVYAAHMIVARKVFEMPDQQRFGELSGDLNPMHFDRVYSRRTQAGAPVVHGIHTLLWLLNAVGAAHPELASIATLKVRFRRMLYLGEPAEARVVRLTAELLQARVVVDGVDVVSVTAALGPPPERGASPKNSSLHPHLSVPRELRFDEMASQEGAITIADSSARLAAEFPALSRAFDARRVATLACSSYLVGMVVPGLHSIFLGLDLRATDGFSDDRELAFQVNSVDPRFRRAHIDILGGGLAGIVQVAVRAAPVSQAGIETLAALVTPHEFASSKSLIVGGSRGLGELTAKLLAAGGSHVTITYANGTQEAGRIVSEIRSWGGQASAVHYDVRGEAQRQLEALTPPTHLYYFATPLIARRKSGIFSRARFAEFNEFYIDGFRNLIEAAHNLQPTGIAAFYPSSHFVTTRPAEMTEYAMSKAAAEVLCADLATYLPNVRILAERLPRVLTDQTAGLGPGEVEDPLAVMLPIVRAMHAR
jgi:hypothetical protein